MTDFASGIQRMWLKISSQPKKFRLKMSHSDKSDVRTINWENQLEGVTAVISFHLTEYICWFITHICKMQGPHCLKM